MAYQIKLEVFEGPFDLLFHLLDKNEVDIYDIPIAQITEQYLEYIATMQLMDLEVASEFLLLAATLLSIKSRTLLPKPPKIEDEIDELGSDPRDELVERLLEYKRFKEVADYLKNREQVQERVYTRPNEDEMYLDLFNEESPLSGVTLYDLLDALKEVLDRVVDNVELTGEIVREEIRIKDKIREILGRLVFQPNGIRFKDLFRSKVTRVEVVVTFLALLELIKISKVTIHQSKAFGEITIYGKIEESA